MFYKRRLIRDGRRIEKKNQEMRPSNCENFKRLMTLYLINMSFRRVSGQCLKVIMTTHNYRPKKFAKKLKRQIRNGSRKNYGNNKRCA